MYKLITPELIEELWCASWTSDAVIGYDVGAKAYRVTESRFVAEAHLVITYDELHGMVPVITNPRASLYDELASIVDERESVRCDVCGAKSTMPMGWPCEDCADELTGPRGHSQNPDDRERVMDR